MEKIDKSIVKTAIIWLAILEIVAMIMGINGTMRAIIFTMIGALAGLSVDTKRFIK